MPRRPCLFLSAALLLGVCLLATGCRAIDRLTAEAPVVSNIRGMAAGLGVPFTGMPTTVQLTITPAQLQTALMAYADEYMGRLSQSMEDMIALNAEDPDLRLRMHRRKLYNSMAVQTIATEPNPEVALLDMVVVVTLDRIVVEDAVEPSRPGRERLVRTLTELEEEIWEIAAAVLDEEHNTRLHDAILEYRKRHPEQTEVSFVRFADFAGSRHQTPLLEALHQGLIPRILPSVDEAARAVDETRMVAERALHLMEKMPIFLSWQTQLMLYELAVTPEAEQMESGLAQMNESAELFAQSTDRFARSFETLATQFSGEQGALLEALNDQQSQLSQLMEDARATMASAEHSMAVARETSAKFEELVNAVGIAAPPLGEAAQSIDRMFQNFRRDPNRPRDPNARRFDITEYTQAINELAVATQELQGLLGSTKDFLESQALTEGLDRLNESGESMLDKTFWRALVLIAIFWGLALITLVAVRRLAPPRA